MTLVMMPPKRVAGACPRTGMDLTTSSRARRTIQNHQAQLNQTVARIIVASKGVK
jgi:hypothetical protein